MQLALPVQPECQFADLGALCSTGKRSKAERCPCCALGHVNVVDDSVQQTVGNDAGTTVTLDPLRCLTVTTLTTKKSRDIVDFL